MTPHASLPLSGSFCHGLGLILLFPVLFWKFYPLVSVLPLCFLCLLVFPPFLIALIVSTCSPLPCVFKSAFPFVLCQFPAHVGLEGNEDVDILAKQSLKSQTIDREIPLSRAEGKALIKKHVGKVWQEYWDIQDTGRHLYNIQTQVGLGRRMGRSRREEAIITRLRIGHTGLNDTLHRIGRHTDGKCGHCGEKESVRHVLLECGAYEEERRALAAAGKRVKMVINIKNLLGRELISHVIKYLKSTRLIHRI